jgi:multiple RNA-binding domain-containing protein 1
MVEFFESSEARTAFRSLAYSKFKHVPLFLEWAPVKALGSRITEFEETVAAPKTIEDNEIENYEETPSLASATTLYIKNLNFSTTSDTLKTVFSVTGPIKSARVATKKMGDRVLSLGFGFVEFERKESLNRALDELQGHVVDGHALLLKKSSARTDSSKDSSSHRRRNADDADGENEQNTKLVVRNIPFEAGEKEVRELFKTFAQLKHVRLPRRFDGRHRGFGFVEFLTHQEAVNAKTTLAHTHLYGRHLVLEWAKPEMESDDAEKIEELREKTRKRMNVCEKPAAGKRMRLDKTADVDAEMPSASEDEE